MNRKYFKLGTCGLNAHDEVWIRAVLSVALPNLQHEWEVVPSEQAQVLICRPDSMLQPEIRERVEHTILILHHGERPIPGAMTLHAPLRSASLLSVLNHCGEELTHSRASLFSLGGAARKGGDVGMMLPTSMNWLRDLHQQLIAGKDAAILIDGRHCYSVTHKDRRLHYIDRQTSIISPDHLVYAWSQEALEGFQGWQTIGIDQAMTGSTFGHDIWPLEQLLWKLGHLLSQHGLLPKALPTKVFQLCRWPDYGLIGNYHGQFLLTAALTRQALAFQEIVQITNLNESQINSLLHSALCCNLLWETDSHAVDTPVNQVVAKAAEPAPQVHAMSRMLGVLRQALGLRTV